GDRTAEAGQPVTGGVLVEVGVDRGGGRVLHQVRPRKVGKPLPEVDRLVLDGEPAHLTEDRLTEAAQPAGPDLLHHCPLPVSCASPASRPHRRGLLSWIRARQPAGSTAGGDQQQAGVVPAILGRDGAGVQCCAGGADRSAPPALGPHRPGAGTDSWAGQAYHSSAAAPTVRSPVRTSWKESLTPSWTLNPSCATPGTTS